MSRAALQNRILASMPEVDLKPWLPHLRAVKLTRGEVLHAPGEPIRSVYFPTSAIISLVYTPKDAQGLEIGMVGREGVVGVSLVNDDTGPPHWAVVQSDGWGFRLDAKHLRRDLDHAPLTRLLLRHTLAVATQMAQTSACMRQHRVLEQLSRWLLLCLDRLASTSLATTHGVIAAKLGVRRASVAACIADLERRGLVRHVRGLVTVTDRAGLERCACDCYSLIRDEYRRLELLV